MSDRARVECTSCGEQVPYNHVRVRDSGRCRLCATLLAAGRAELIADMRAGLLTRRQARELGRDRRMPSGHGRLSPERYERRYRKMWGIHDEHYDRLAAEAGGACMICHRPNVKRSRGADSGSVQRLALDHDHETGRFRGLLCDGCNQGIGRFGDSPELLREAADYLERHRDAMCQYGHPVYLVWSFCPKDGSRLG